MYKASGAIIASLETDQPLDVKKVRRLRRRFIKYAGEHGRAGTLRFDGFLKVLLVRQLQFRWSLCRASGSVGVCFALPCRAACVVADV